MLFMTTKIMNNSRTPSSLDWVADDCLSGGQTSDWDTEWAAGDVVHAEAVAEVDRLWITTVLTTDTDRKVWACDTAIFDGDLHEAADTVLIDCLEWRVLEETPFVVVLEE